MDPIITVFRPIAAFVTGVVAGVATNLWGTKRPGPVPSEPSDGGAPDLAPPAPAAPHAEIPLPLLDGEPRPAGGAARVRRIFAYAFRELLDETAHWLVLGVVLAALVAVLLPTSVI